MFCNVEPFTLAAVKLVHDIVQGESELFKIPWKRQIALMYKVFQYCWLWSLGELPLLVHARILQSVVSGPFHKGKGKVPSAPRFNVNPKSVASLCSDSLGYVHCHLEGYPLKMRYPESASEQQQWCPWEATRYSNVDDDEVTLEVTNIADTLVFQTVSAFLRGSDHHGDTIMLAFQPYTYRNISTQSKIHLHWLQHHQ